MMGMTSIEIKKLIKEGAIIFFVLLALFAAMAVTDKDAYLAPPIELSLILFSSFIGWSMFERERQEGAMEYLLSLPVSRTKLFLVKFIPRTIYVLLILTLYYFIHDRYETYFFLTFFNFALFFLSVYLLSASFSLSIRSFLGTFFLTIFLAVSLFSLIKILDWSKEESAIAIQAGLSLLVIPVLFFVLFQKFDIKPIAYFNIKFIPSLVIIVLLLFGITYITTKVEWAYSFLTKDGSIFKITRNRTVLETRGNKKFIYKKPIEPILEDKGKIYAVFRPGKKLPRQLLRLNLETGKIEKIFRGEPGWSFILIPDSGIKSGEQLYFLLYNYDSKKYRVAETKEDEIRTFDININLLPEERIYVFHGVVADPLQFFVFTMSEDRPSRVFRIFADGESEFLFEADGICVLENKLTMFTRTELTVYEVGKELKPVFQRIGEVRILKRRFFNLIPPKPLLKIDNITYLFDIKNETFTRVNLKSLPYDYLISGKEKNLRIVFASRSEVSFSEWTGGRLRPGKVWYLKTDPDEFRIFRVFSSGVVVMSKKDNEIFLFDEDE